MKAVRGGTAVGILLSIFMFSSPATADLSDINESYGEHCNDALFDSDGGGISSCIDLAARFYDDWYGAFGGFQSGPEAKTGAKWRADPLSDRGKLVFRLGKYMSAGGLDFALTARLGATGGFVDDLTHDTRDSLHGIFGRGVRPQRGNHSLNVIAGVSGHGWRPFEMTASESIKAVMTPYVHGSVGTDNVELGGGLVLGLQAIGADRPLPFMEPKNGAYGPSFGGDGIGIFGAARGVAHESFYDNREKHFIGEAGIIAQMTFAELVRPAFFASCTTKPYSGAPDADCKMVFRLGFTY